MSDITIDILSVDGKPAQPVNLPGSIFAASLNIPLIHQVVVAQLAAARQGTHATKTRGQVSGGGAKPWRQKGTGRARHGSRRAPQWTGGGVALGPQPRSHAQKTPKKMIAAALCSALSERLGDSRLFVLDAIISGETPSTRQALEALSVIGEYDSCVVVLHRDEDIAWLSLRNVFNVHALAVDQLNAYDVVSNQMVVFTKPALEEFLARFAAAEVSEDDFDDDLSEAPTEEETVEVDESATPVKTVKAVEAAQPLEVEDEVAPAQTDEPAEPEVAEPEAVEPEVIEPEVVEPEVVEPEPEPVEPEVTEPEVTDSESVEPEEAEPETESTASEDGSYRGSDPPDGFDIKANEDSKRYHTPTSPWYKRLTTQLWFNSPEAAKKAGFTDVMESKK